MRGSALFYAFFRTILLGELHFSGSIQRPAEIIGGMREAHHAGFVSGRGEEDALGAHLAVELLEKILIALLHFREIGHRTVIEVRREHGGDGVHLNRHTLRSENVLQFAGKGGNRPFQFVIILMLQNTQRGDARSQKASRPGRPRLPERRGA